MFKKAVIIAGGLGSRMRPLTDYVPKPMVRINEKPLIGHVIDFFNSHNITDISITYGHLAPILLNYVYDKSTSLINTINKDNAYFLFNSDIKYLDEPIIVCPCDLIIDVDFKKVYEEYNSLDEPAACIIPILANNNADYIHSIDGRVVKIVRDQPSNICASGLQILNPAKINSIVDSNNNFYDVWSSLIEKNSLCVTKTNPHIWKAFDSINNLITT